jgi:hypothetical protein
MKGTGLTGPDRPELKVSHSLPLLSWQEEMCSKGFIMLPMIWRCGTCVSVTEESGGMLVGCLAPPEDVEDENGHIITYDGNFCLSEMCWCAWVRRSRCRCWKCCRLSSR